MPMDFKDYRCQDCHVYIRDDVLLEATSNPEYELDYSHHRISPVIGGRHQGDAQETSRVANELERRLKVMILCMHFLVLLF